MRIFVITWRTVHNHVRGYLVVQCFIGQCTIIKSSLSESFWLESTPTQQNNKSHTLLINLSEVIGAQNPCNFVFFFHPTFLCLWNFPIENPQLILFYELMMNKYWSSFLPLMIISPVWPSRCHGAGMEKGEGKGRVRVQTAVHSRVYAGWGRKRERATNHKWQLSMRICYNWSTGSIKSDFQLLRVISIGCDLWIFHLSGALKNCRHLNDFYFPRGTNNY